MRSTVNHTPPSNTQPEPPDNTSEHVMAQVRAWSAASLIPSDLARPFGLPLVIHTQSAMEIASWWQAPRNAFTPFASTGTIVEGLAEDIAAEIQSHEDTDEMIGVDPDERATYLNATDALRALDAYVRACTLPVVWTVGHNIAGYLPEAEVQTFIDYADAVQAFRDMVEAAPAEMTGADHDESEETQTECDDLDATVRAYLADEVPSVVGGRVFGDPRELSLSLRPESRPLPTVYWLNLSTHALTYGAYLAEGDA